MKTECEGWSCSETSVQLFKTPGRLYSTIQYLKEDCKNAGEELFPWTHSKTTRGKWP